MSPDQESEARLRGIYPEIAIRVRAVYSDMRRLHGFAMRATEGLRSMERQAQLYMQGRTAPGPIVTNSPPGQSIHHYGLAVDSCFYGRDPYLKEHHRGEMLWVEYGRLARQHGLHWGGDWARIIDRPHVQFTFGLSLKEIRELYQFGGMDAVWMACDEIRGVEIGTGWKKEGASLPHTPTPTS